MPDQLMQIPTRKKKPAVSRVVYSDVISPVRSSGQETTPGQFSSDITDATDTPLDDAAMEEFLAQQIVPMSETGVEFAPERAEGQVIIRIIFSVLIFCSIEGVTGRVTDANVHFV